MDLIKFDDHCVISTSLINEYEAEELTNVYEGKCRYQQGVQTYQGISQRNSVVFIPSDEKIKEGYVASVTESNGLVHEGRVKTVRHIQMPLTYERLTRVELEYVSDVTPKCRKV